MKKKKNLQRERDEFEGFKTEIEEILNRIYVCFSLTVVPLIEKFHDVKLSDNIAGSSSLNE